MPVNAMMKTTFKSVGAKAAATNRPAAFRTPENNAISDTKIR